MTKPTFNQLQQDDDFIYYGACVWNDSCYSGLCTTEEANDGLHYDLFRDDIGYSDLPIFGEVVEIWEEYQTQKALGAI